MSTTPEWLRERNNDPYGTPNNHPFWTEQEHDEYRGYKVFRRDGVWCAFDPKYNAWYRFGELAEMIDHINEYGSVDIHA